VTVRSELWSAASETPLDPGANVRMTMVEGLFAWVRRLEEDEIAVQGDTVLRRRISVS